MPRGGHREGAGRKPDPNSARQKAKAKKATADAARGRGHTLANGQKAPDAPPDWPFGTKPPDPPAPALPAEPGVDSDDGLTDAQRAGMSPLDYLLAVMRSSKSSKSARMTAAIQAAPYMHARVAPMGKKEERAKEAGKAATGRFAAASAPRLAAANGKKV